MNQSKAIDILLVEDNPADVYLIQRAIVECRPRIWLWPVPSGKDAFAFLRKEPPFQNAPSPALILLDLNLPGMKGAAVLTQLRSLPAYQATPVIVFGGNEQVVEETRYLQLGANAYVEKTADFVTYLTRIQAIMKDWLGADCPPP